jgi:hypothetical protein
MANWEHHINTEEELKELVRAVYDCKVFTSLQCPDYLIGSGGANCILALNAD